MNRIITIEGVKKTIFGLGSISQLGSECRNLGVSSALIVFDPGLLETDLESKIKEILKKSRLKPFLFKEIMPEPSPDCANKGAQLAREEKVKCVIGIGGGSTMDVAKAIAVLAKNEGRAEDYIGLNLVKKPGLPTIMIPTTAGTGSETTTVAVLDLTELKIKSGISHAFLRPTMACMDPILTVSMAPEVTASTGMDALVHSLESYTSKPYDQRQKPAHPSERTVYVGCNPFTDIWDERAIEFIGLFLRRAVADPYDLEARWHMMAAATFAGIGFGNTGVHIPHAMAYPLASLIHKYRPDGYPVTEPLTPHGQAVSITTPAAMRFTASIWPERHALAAELLGADTTGLTDREAAMLLPETIIDLMEDIGFPNGFSAFGYTESDIPQIVEGTIKQQRLLSGCPRHVGEKELTRIALESMNNW